MESIKSSSLTRTLWGIPNAMDVLSNLPFILASAAGLMGVQKMGLRNLERTQNSPNSQHSGSTHALFVAFFAAFILTGFASAYYHWAPDANGLAAV